MRHELGKARDLNTVSKSLEPKDRATNQNGEANSKNSNNNINGAVSADLQTIPETIYS